MSVRVIPARASIAARDLDAALDFYTGALGLPLIVRGGDFALVGPTGGMHLELRAVRSGEARSKVGFLVDSGLESAMEDLRSRGVGGFGEVEDRGLVRFAFFDDPDGNALYLLEAPALAAERDRRDRTGQREPLLEHLGVRWLKLDPDAVVLEVDLRDDLRGPAGALLGGVTTTLIDFAAATCVTLAIGTAAVATTRMAVDFIAPGRRGPIRAAARRVDAGGDALSVRVEVSDERPAQRTIATADVHFVRRED